MTQTDELREKIKSEVGDAIAEVYDAYNPIAEALNQSADAIMALMEQVRADERERCASLFDGKLPGTQSALIAAAIRSQRDKT